MTEVEIFKQSLDVSRIVMLITIVMAVTSVVFSALTMAFERSHNKRSIKPFLNLIALAEGEELLLKIKNVGMGTMILNSIKIVSGSSEEVELENLKNRYPGCKIDVLKIDHEIGISINEEIDILRMKNTIDDKTIEEMHDYRIVIKYSDLYDQDYEKEIRIIDIKSCALTIAST